MNSKKSKKPVSNYRPSRSPANSKQLIRLSLLAKLRGFRDSSPSSRLSQYQQLLQRRLISPKGTIGAEFANSGVEFLLSNLFGDGGPVRQHSLWAFFLWQMSDWVFVPLQDMSDMPEHDSSWLTRPQFNCQADRGRNHQHFGPDHCWQFRQKKDRDGKMGWWQEAQERGRGHGGRYARQRERLVPCPNKKGVAQQIPCTDSTPSLRKLELNVRRIRVREFGSVSSQRILHQSQRYSN